MHILDSRGCLHADAKSSLHVAAWWCTAGQVEFRWMDHPEVDGE